MMDIVLKVLIFGPFFTLLWTILAVIVYAIWRDVRDLYD